MDVNAARALLVKIADAAGAVVDQQFAQRPHSGSTPPGSVCNHQMGQLQQFLPLMPLRKAQKGIHSDDEASISVVNTKSSAVVFAYAVNKKNTLHGQQTTAEACAKHLQAHIEGKE